MYYREKWTRRRKEKELTEREAPVGLALDRGPMWRSECVQILGGSQ